MKRQNSARYVVSSPFPVGVKEKAQQQSAISALGVAPTSIRRLSLASFLDLKPTCMILSQLGRGVGECRFWAPLAPMPTFDPTHTGNPSLWCLLQNLHKEKQGWIKTGLHCSSLFSNRPAFQLSKLHFVCSVNRCLYVAALLALCWWFQLSVLKLIWIVPTTQRRHSPAGWVIGDTGTPRGISQSMLLL